MEVSGYTKSFSMDQGVTLGNDQEFHALFNAPLTDGKRQGICCGLSMVWVARRMMFHDESAKERKAGLVSTGGFRFGGRSQDIMMAAPDPTAATSMADYVEAWFGPSLTTYVLRPVLSAVKSVNNATAGGYAGGVAELSTATGVYTLYNMSFPHAGHMVASYASHGSMLGGKHFYFFDPNMGEYRISTGDAEKFMKKMFEAYEAMWAIEGVLAFEVVRG